MSRQEFLPLCDVLFNAISLASYFCDVVFDLVAAYALLQRGSTLWSAVILSFAVLSLAVSQAVSLRWYLHTIAARQSETKPSLVKHLMRAGVVLVHVLQLGVLWRYFKLFLPVDVRYVKYEVRDLCMLRLVHAFVEAAPMLLVQLYLVLSPPRGPAPPPDSPVLLEAPAHLRDLNILSVSLSLFTVCWALASFSKNVRMHNVHKLVLTWLGVIFQLVWRVGTVSCRSICLVAYALLYGEWLLLVLLLHWTTMFLWLVSPNNLFHRERLSRHRKATLCSLVALVYVFAYVNLQESNHRPKMFTFYLVMAVENSVLMYSWYAGTPDASPTLPLLALSAFLLGLLFMLLYYRYFHVRRLNYEAGGRLSPGLPNYSKGGECGGGGGGCFQQEEPSAQGPGAAHDEDPAHATPPTPSGAQGSPEHHHQQPSAKATTRYRYYGGAHHHGGIPGVFNCRFTNPYAMTKRKKKKPTSFVPPPSVAPSVPFWCRPLSNQVIEGEGGRGGQVVDIQAKLEEKKKQQLAELRVIEEEMLRGKLAPLADCSPHLLHHYLSCEETGGLPYTLPRQTRYFRRTRLGRHLRPDHYLPPANSSDGDVDSGDDNDSECWHTSIPHLPFRLQQNRVRHETKL